MSGPSSSESLAVAVVTAVAKRENVETHTLPPLYETVDPDALEELFRHSGRDDSLRVSFAYCGYDVTVETNGQVSLTPLSETSSIARSDESSGSQASSADE